MRVTSAKRAKDMDQAEAARAQPARTESRLDDVRSGDRPFRTVDRIGVLKLDRDSSGSVCQLYFSHHQTQPSPDLKDRKVPALLSLS